LDPVESEYVLGSIALTNVQRNATFCDNTNTLPLKYAENQAPIPRGFRSDVSVHKNLDSTLEWIPSDVLASKPTQSLEMLLKGAERTESAGKAASGSLLNKLALGKPLSSRERHQLSHWGSLDGQPPYAKINDRMIRRCKKGYLFDCEKNRSILSDDPWLQDIWSWIEGI
jgi:hypothetical protein